MVTKKIQIIVAVSLMALAALPVSAGQRMVIGLDSNSGCVPPIIKTIAEAGTPEFRDAVNYYLGRVDAVKDTCPDAHISIKPSRKKLKSE